MNDLPKHSAIVKTEVYDERPPLHQLRRTELWSYARGIIEFPANASKDDMIVLVEAAWAKGVDFSRRPGSRPSSPPPATPKRHVKYRGKTDRWCVLEGEMVVSTQHETRKDAEELLDYG